MCVHEGVWGSGGGVWGRKWAHAPQNVHALQHELCTHLSFLPRPVQDCVPFSSLLGLLGHLLAAGALILGKDDEGSDLQQPSRAEACHGGAHKHCACGGPGAVGCEHAMGHPIMQPACESTPPLHTHTHTV